jgi:hypothetical protein
MDWYIPPDNVISAEYSFPALADCERKAIQAKMFENSNATQGTPWLLTFPRNFGAIPLRAIWVIVLEAT